MKKEEIYPVTGMKGNVKGVLRYNKQTGQSAYTGMENPIIRKGPGDKFKKMLPKKNK